MLFRSSDPTLETYLVRDRGFSDNGAQDLIAEYKATIAFAKLGHPDTLSNDTGASNECGLSSGKNAVNDTRQWRIRGGSDVSHPAEKHVSQLSSGPVATDAPSSLRLQNEIFGVNFAEKNEREWLRGPLSKETSYRLLVTGSLGPKEIGKLIILLEAQKSVLSDDSLL